MHWQASRDLDGAIDHDFQGTIFCPDCFDGSRSNRHLNTPFLNDGHRLLLKERDR